LAELLWAPSEDQVANANMTAFRRTLERQWNVSLPDFAALHDFSIQEMEKFWVVCGIFATSSPMIGVSAF
jgi:acetoacetyl-CoA synthetase